MNKEKVAEELLKVAKDLVSAEHIITAGCEKLPEGKMRDMCEKKKKEAMMITAGCEKLPEGKMRDMCEKKKEEGKDKKARLELVGEYEEAKEDGKYKRFTGYIDYKGNKGKVKNATFELKNGKILWKDGVWLKGLWNYGVWLDGLWKDGTWAEGIWKNGNWNKGTWWEGDWQGGNWNGGVWKDSSSPHPNER